MAGNDPALEIDIAAVISRVQKERLYKDGLEAGKRWEKGFKDGTKAQAPTPDANAMGKAGRTGGFKYGSAFEKEVKTRLSRSLSSLGEIELKADSSKLEKDYAALGKRMKDLLEQNFASIDTKKIASEINKITSQIHILRGRNGGRDFGMELNLESAGAQMTLLQHRLGETGTEAARAFRENFESTLKSELGAVANGLPDLKITSDTSDADRDLQQLKTDILTLSGKQIDVDITTGEAQMELASIQTRLETLDGRDVDIQVDVDATGAAVSLTSFAALAETLDDRDVDVQVDVEAKLYIERNYQAPCSIIDLAKIVGINQTKLKSGFKELFGTTVFGYVRELQMQEARRLLLEEKCYVSEVADQVGYKQPQHFTAAFKRRFGILPSELK